MKPFDIKREYGRRIKQIRERDGLTQEKLGEKVGIDKQQISRYERGINQPRQEILDRIVQYGNVSPNFFEIGEPPPIYEVYTAEEKKILDNVREILKSGNEEMIKILKVNIKAIHEAACTAQKNDEDKSKGDD